MLTLGPVKWIDQANWYGAGHGAMDRTRRNRRLYRDKQSFLLFQVNRFLFSLCEISLCHFLVTVLVYLKSVLTECKFNSRIVEIVAVSYQQGFSWKSHLKLMVAITTRQGNTSHIKHSSKLSNGFRWHHWCWETSIKTELFPHRCFLFGYY